MKNAIWVYASHRGGTIDPVVLELVGKALELGQSAQAPVEICLLGHKTEKLAAQLEHAGAATVRVVDSPRLAGFNSALYAHVLAELAGSHHPQILLFGAGNLNASLAARVGARLGTGLSAHCVDLKFEGNNLVQTVPGFGGHLMANIVCPKHRPQIATVTAGIFRAAAGNGRPAQRVEEKVEIPEGIRGSRAKSGEARETSDDGLLVQSPVVVAGGFGVGSKENWRLVEDLARAVHGVVGATRPPVDEGWATVDRMIGASGKVIAPELYIAVGISGMMHHTVGVHGARTIVAINNDPKAPIFGSADYGLVGDLREIVPALVARITRGEALAPKIKPPDHTRTPEDYKASLSAMKPNMYKKGKLIEDPVTDPVTRRTVEGHAQVFEAARDPRYQDLLTTTSHLTGKRISRYLSIIRTPEEQILNSKMKRLMFQMTGTCTGGRCVGWTCINALWPTTWDMDRELGTDYHERLKTWLLSAQERDITLAGGLTDPKGHRRRSPPSSRTRTCSCAS